VKCSRMRGNFTEFTRVVFSTFRVNRFFIFPTYPFWPEIIFLRSRQAGRGVTGDLNTNIRIIILRRGELHS